METATLALELDREGPGAVSDFAEGTVEPELPQLLVALASVKIATVRTTLKKTPIDKVSHPLVRTYDKYNEPSVDCKVPMVLIVSA